MSKIEVGDWVSVPAYDSIFHRKPSTRYYGEVTNEEGDTFLIALTNGAVIGFRKEDVELEMKNKKKEEPMQFKLGQKVRVVTPLEEFYGKYLGPAKDIVGGYADAKIETDEGRTVRVKKKFIHPVEKQEEGQAMEKIEKGDIVRFDQTSERAKVVDIFYDVDGDKKAYLKRIGPYSPNNFWMPVKYLQLVWKNSKDAVDFHQDALNDMIDDWVDEIRGRRTEKVEVDNNYQSLFSVLMEALDQASRGKGRERHSNDEPFEKQEIVHNAKVLGLAAPVYQIRKKSREAIRLAEEKGSEAAKQELLGVIVYATAAIVSLEDEES